MKEVQNQAAPLLEVNNLVKDYGALRAVDHLSLAVCHGEVFGFLGPNGAGKTTSIRMMCGLLKPTSGEVRIGGERLGGRRDAEVRAMVGICPQENILWSKLTCFEQLVFSARMYDVPGRVARERALALLQEMGLEAKRNKLASTLSGGMKRRMNVILALMHDPEILVLDEPEAGLDPQSRVMVRDFIRKMARQKTVILTTHNMDEADRIADRVAIIDSGRLLRLDSPANLKHSVGQGDILELKLIPSRNSKLSTLEKELEAEGFSVLRDSDQFMIRAMNLIPRIHEVHRLCEKAEITISELKVRENTLEDVFLHLTGRSLRS